MISELLSCITQHNVTVHCVTSLTSIDGRILINNFLSFSPGVVKPDGAISKVVVFSGQVLGKDGPIRQSVGIRTIKRVGPVLPGVVAVPWNQVQIHIL